MNSYTDEEKSVLEIKFEDGSKGYLNNAMFMIVSNPYLATRYYPIDDIPTRQEDRNKDLKWLENSVDAELSFVSYLEAYKEYKQKNKTEYESSY